MSDSPDFVLSCPVPLPAGERLLLGHGSGGVLTHRLITELFAPVFGDPELTRLGDAAVVELPGGDRLAFTTDSFVVQPAFFPGSNIGELAVNGTVNDLAMVGAIPALTFLTSVARSAFDRDWPFAAASAMRFDAGVPDIPTRTVTCFAASAPAILSRCGLMPFTSMCWMPPLAVIVGDPASAVGASAPKSSPSAVPATSKR